jgi:probable rRNA maturation factor
MRAAVAEKEFTIDAISRSELWKGHEPVLAQALEAAAKSEGVAGTVSLLLGDDVSVAALNKQFRGKDGPTNVLSFPPAKDEAGFLGDIALAAETIVEEAQFQGKSFENHAAHLVVHGFLHLLGYDHMDPADAENMEGRERAILLSMGIEDPYA